MELARGVHVEDGGREHQPSEQARDPSDDFVQRRRRSPAEDVVGLIDRLKKRFEMLRGDRFDGRADQDDRLVDGLQSRLDQRVEPGARTVDRDDPALNRPAPFSLKPCDARGEDAGGRIRLGGRGRIDQKDQGDAGALEGFAMEVGLERVERTGGLGRRH